MLQERRERADRIAAEVIGRNCVERIAQTEEVGVEERLHVQPAGKEDVAVTRVRFEHDLLSAPPILEKIRPGTDWIGHRPAACVSVSGNDFARDRCCRRSREIGKQIVRRMFEIEADRVAIDRLHAFDRRVVVELPGLLRGGDGSFRPHDPFIEDQLGDRAHLRIEHPLPGIDVVCSSELALRPFEHRIVGKIDTVLELDGPGLAVG